MNPVNPFTYNAYKSDFADPDIVGVELEIVSILNLKKIFIMNFKVALLY